MSQQPVQACQFANFYFLMWPRSHVQVIGSKGKSREAMIRSQNIILFLALNQKVVGEMGTFQVLGGPAQL